MARSRPATREPASPTPRKTRHRSTRAQITPPAPEPFTVDCEVGELVCSFVPGAPHPEGFIQPFEDRFAEHLGLTASVSWHLERKNLEQGTVWLLRYRAKEGGRWINKSEVLKDCVTEDEAWLAASELMNVSSQAKEPMVHYLSGQARQKFLAGLSEALQWALAELINYSCDYVKIMKADTPQARRDGEKMQQRAEQQHEDWKRQMNDQLQNDTDPTAREAARQALERARAGEHLQWNVFPGFRSDDDDSIATPPPINATELRNEALKRAKERLVRQYDITQGGDNRKSSYDFADEAKRTDFRTRVDAIRQPWRDALKEFESNEDRDVPRDKSYRQGVSTDLLREALAARAKYSGAGKAIPVNLTPKAFALKQAARELGIKNETKSGKVSDFSFKILSQYYGSRSLQK